MPTVSDTVDLRSAAAAVATIVGHLLRQDFASTPVPLGALLAPLARLPGLERPEWYADGLDCVVLERIRSVRSLPFAEEDPLLMEASTGAEGHVIMRLLAAGQEAFRCDMQVLRMERSRLAAGPTGGHRADPEAQVRFHVEPDDHLAYAEASGDFNPLHVDEVLCAELGMPGRIVHGTLLATLAEALADARGSGSLTARFVTPCFVGEALAASLVERPEGGRRVSIHGADGRLVCVADWRA